MPIIGRIFDDNAPVEEWKPTGAETPEEGSGAEPELSSQSAGGGKTDTKKGKDRPAKTAGEKE